MPGFLPENSQKKTFPRKRVAFICLGNSCRSIMAEALARHFWGAQAEALSAGIHPLGYVAQETLEVLEEMGVATTGLYSKGLAALGLETLQAIVNLTDYSLRGVVPAFLHPRIVQRPVRDPFGFTLEAYRRTRDEIMRMVLAESELWWKL